MFITVLNCSKCGNETRNTDWVAGRPAVCGKCDAPAMVGERPHPYGTLFRNGDRAKVFAPQTLGFRHDGSYPLRRLHEAKVIVTVLEEGPDERGSVLCRIPFGYMPEGSKTSTYEMPILYSVLKAL